jgi:O-antigen ligase
MRYRREVGLFITMTAMLVSLFISRAFLSSSLIAFLLVSFIHRGFRHQVRDFFNAPLLWGMTLLFLFPLVSGLWSSDLETWQQQLQVKLPLLFLPLAFAGRWHFPPVWWTRMGYIFLFLLLLASGWTIYRYLGQSETVHDWYLQARTMVTPLHNDHVRFSWLVATGALLSGYFVSVYWSKDRLLAVLFLVMLTWFIVFLHILAARTGLFALYIMLAVAGIVMISGKLKPWTGIVLLAMVIVLPLLAYKTLPSFRNRVNYIRYELDYFRHAGYLPGSNDAVRVISMKAGWNVMLQAPFTGVGYGDIRQAMDKWYDRHVPQMNERDRIYPSNQWLMYGAGLGIPGFVAFLFCMAIPFTARVTSKPAWWLLNIAAAGSFLFDIGLEVQFGVFIYAFTILWWYSWLRRWEK